MNNLEKRMVEALVDLRENHHVTGVKAEFEAEGTRMEEALRLKDVISKAGLDLTVKVGGCEALLDMYNARAIGVKHLVAPMVETPYALHKYLGAVKLAFPPEERDEVDFLVNIETIDACRNFGKMLELPEIAELDGVVLGRVDLTGSMGKDREYVNSPEVLGIAREIFSQAKAKGMECVVGGGVSKETVPFIKELPAGFVDRYETRKVIFECPAALSDGYDKGILKAVGFELMWLKNKRDYYGMIYAEDNQRIVMLESRYRRLIEEAGGKYE
ncbi:citrate lyase beta subunit [Geomonas terrae]|uniref:Citrate lyase beta subunit n=1 Tax=Geomonas terrae TaxID=2562681 RepID=A0A4S1CAU2_9BACT|nr:aldolase/citrate lyase family protein [Geomonas terrae]TGU70050.1 citrate lyase beta subunit [Geomonas terrae]